MPQRKKPHILIIDDGAALVRILERRLNLHGYRVSAVPTAEDGLAATCVEEPDLIILDDMLPGMMGTTAISELRRFTENPIIFVTGFPSEELKSDAMAMGVADFLPKPLDQNLLLQRIAELVAQGG